MDPLEQLKSLHLSAVEQLKNAIAVPDLSNFTYKPLSDRTLETMRNIRTWPQAKSEDIQEAIHRHIQERQASLADDEQLLVYSTSGSDSIIVHTLAFPNWHTVILYGVDLLERPSSAIVSVDAVHLTFKVVKLEAPAKPYRVGFIPVDK